MSATTAQRLVYAVQTLLKDYSFTDPKNSVPQILSALDDAMFDVHGKLPIRASVNAAFIPIVANTVSYTISEVDPFSLCSFYLTVNGTEINRESIDNLMSFRAASPQSVGAPSMIAFTEAASGVVTAQIWPKPVAADTVLAVVSPTVTRVFQGLMGTDLSATTLNFGPYGTRAIEHLAALSFMPERADWTAFAAGQIVAEHQRIAFQSAGNGFLPAML